MSLIPHSALQIQNRTANELFIAVSFGYNGDEWPKEYAFGPTIFEFASNEPMPKYLASTFGGYARYVRTDRRAVELQQGAAVIGGLRKVFEVERRIVSSFSLCVPATVQVPYPQECDPWITQVTVVKLVDGKWIPGSPIRELKREDKNGDWQVVTNLNNARNELGHIVGVELSFWFTEAGEYEVWFDWKSIEATRPTGA